MTPAVDLTGSPAAPITPSDKQIDIISNPEQVTKVAETPKLEEEAISPKLAALARREKAIRQRVLEERRKIDVDRQALEAEKQEVAQFRQWKQRLSDDPVSVLNEAGVSYDRVTSQYLNQNPENARIQSLEQEIKSLRSEQEASKNQFKQSQDQQYQQAKKQIRTEAKLLIDGDESFEAIRSQGDMALDAVVELIEQTFNDPENGGYLMTVNEASEAVEEYLIEQALGFARLKKVQSKLAPAPVEPQEKTQAQEQRQPSLNTLSNRIMPSTTKNLTERERRERAVLAFQGKLS